MENPTLNKALELNDLSPDDLDTESENDDHTTEPTAQPSQPQQQITAPVIPGMEMADFETAEGFKLQLVSAHHSAVDLSRQIYTTYLDWKKQKKDEPGEKKKAGYLG